MTSITMPLDCAAFEARLADYLEGDLSPVLRAAVEAHRAACPACAALVADLDAIRDEAARLPELRPPHDLWTGIAARIEAPVVPIAVADRRPAAAPSWLHRPWLAAAAALVLVASTAAVTHTLTAGDAGDGRPTTVAGAPAARPDTAGGAGAALPAAPRETDAPVVASTPATVDAEPPAPQPGTPRSAAPVGSGRLAANVAAAPRPGSIVDEEIAELRALLTQRRVGLDTGTVRVLEQNIAIIDQAIRESRAALSRDPASPFLNQQLTDVLGEKLELMRTAVMLSGDD